jgi:hypothetical protein
MIPGADNKFLFVGRFTSAVVTYSEHLAGESGEVLACPDGTDAVVQSFPGAWEWMTEVLIHVLCLRSGPGPVCQDRDQRVSNVQLVLRVSSV